MSKAKRGRVVHEYTDYRVLCADASLAVTNPDPEAPGVRFYCELDAGGFIVDGTMRWTLGALVLASKS